MFNMLNVIFCNILPSEISGFFSNASLCFVAFLHFFMTSPPAPFKGRGGGGVIWVNSPLLAPDYEIAFN